MAQLKTTNVHGGLHVSGEITQAGSKVLHEGSILTSTGQSTQYPMSQKAVTDAINNSALGMGQEWQDVSESRQFNVIYTNTTGRPIFVNVSCVIPGNTEPAYLMLMVQEMPISANGVEYIRPDSPSQVSTVQGIIPVGSAYGIYGPDSFDDMVWGELR